MSRVFQTLPLFFINIRSGQQEKIFRERLDAADRGTLLCFRWFQKTDTHGHFPPINVSNAPALLTRRARVVTMKSKHFHGLVRSQ